MVSFTPLPVYSPGKGPPVDVGYEAVWTSESVWTLWRVENLLTIYFILVRP
jgi:hypothetical protein